MERNYKNYTMSARVNIQAMAMIAHYYRRKLGADAPNTRSGVVGLALDQLSDILIERGVPPIATTGDAVRVLTELGLMDRRDYRDRSLRKRLVEEQTKEAISDETAKAIVPKEKVKEAVEIFNKLREAETAEDAES